MSQAKAHENPERFATTAIRLNAKVPEARSIAPTVEERILSRGPDDVVVEAGALVDKPAALSMEETAGIGAPFVTAMEGFRRARMPTDQETVVVLGVNGKVGQAAAQIATWRGARVIGVVRKDEGYEGHANGSIDIINSEATDVAARVHELTGGKGAQIVFNSVAVHTFRPPTSRWLSKGGGC
jgi:NADPH:quinone reductase